MGLFCTSSCFIYYKVFFFALLMLETMFLVQKYHVYILHWRSISISVSFVRITPLISWNMWLPFIWFFVVDLKTKLSGLLKFMTEIEMDVWTSTR